MTLHSKMLVSSTKPAENPSTGFLQRSASKREIDQKTAENPRKEIKQPPEEGRRRDWVRDDAAKDTFELLLKEEACLGRHQRKGGERALKVWVAL